jgi:WD40 repeat protein
MHHRTTFAAHDGYVLSLQFSGDSGTLLSCGFDNRVKSWSASDWTPGLDFVAHDKSVNGLALAPDETVLVTCSSDQTVKRWSWPAAAPLGTLQDRKQTVAAVRISADGACIGAAQYGGNVPIWTQDGAFVTRIKASKKNVTSLAFHPDGSLLAAAGLGDDITLWSLPDGEAAGALSGHKTAAGSLAFLGDGSRLVSTGYEGAIKVWDVAARQTLQTIPIEQGAWGLVLAPDQRRAVLLAKARVRLFETTGWTVIEEHAIDTNSVNSAAFSPDGRWLAVGAADGQIRLFEG